MKDFVQSGAGGLVPASTMACHCSSVIRPLTGTVLEVNNDNLVVNFKRVPYDIERAAQAIEASDMPNEYAEMLRTGSG